MTIPLSDLRNILAGLRLPALQACDLPEDHAAVVTETLRGLPGRGRHAEYSLVVRLGPASKATAPRRERRENDDAAACPPPGGERE